MHMTTIGAKFKSPKIGGPASVGPTQEFLMLVMLPTLNTDGHNNSMGAKHKSFWTGVPKFGGQAPVGPSHH